MRLNEQQNSEGAVGKKYESRACLRLYIRCSYVVVVVVCSCAAELSSRRAGGTYS